MNVFKIFEKLKRKYTSLILYCLLDRIPIIIFGDNPTRIDDILIEVSDLIHFRKELVFDTDFISKDEYYNLIQNEDLDYNSQRIHIRCPTNVSLKALSQFDNFTSFLIGIVIPKQKENLYYIKNQIRKKARVFLCIMISSNTVTVELEGIDPKNVDLTLESNILQKISQDTEKSITRMKRVLKENVKVYNLDKDMIKTLLDFEIEKEEIKKNIIRKEIQNFYAGSKRVFYILSRLNLLNNLEINTRIGGKTLLDTIDYIDAPIERILSFIDKEWNLNFMDLIENGKNTLIGEKIQSLWG